LSRKEGGQPWTMLASTCTSAIVRSASRPPSAWARLTLSPQPL